jgi:hypothetical protein
VTAQYLISPCTDVASANLARNPFKTGNLEVSIKARSIHRLARDL